MIWHTYFIAKLFMAGHDHLQLDLWWNLPLALFVYWPLAQRGARLVRELLAWPAALALLIHEAGARLDGHLLRQAEQLTGFSQSYAWELALRLLADSVLPWLAALLVLCLMLDRWLRLDVLLCLTLLCLPLAQWARHAVQPPAPALASNATASDPQNRLQAFWQTESRRSYAFATGASPPVDVVLLHICSLSWDDLDAIGVAGQDLFASFDLVFDQFNSVSSYSGPAMLRLMRANCGQDSHDSLYRPGSERCGLLQQLHLAGYQVQAFLNHDGRFDGFADNLQSETSVSLHTPVVQPGFPVSLKAFDGSPIASDHATLAAWQAAIPAKAAPQALYYNTVTLHDGNRVPGAAPLNMEQSYRQRLDVMLHDLDRFMADLERSGRPTMVVLLPEHGAALRKGAQHIAGLRDTPWPEITHVPVAIKLVGLDAQRPTGLQRPLRVSGPTSYLSLAALMASVIAHPDPWEAAQKAPHDLPRVDFVSDNGESLVTLDEHAMWLRTASSGWQRLPRPEKYPSPHTDQEEP